MGSTFLRRLAAVALAAAAASPVLADSRVRIHNDTGLTLYRFYSTNAGASKWGHDVMGSTTLPSGQYMTMNFENAYGYCLFDFRAIFDDGTELTRGNVNVCEVSDYSYTP